MMYFTPAIPVSGKIKMKKIITGPREETLMLIRHFARIYGNQPEQKQYANKYLVN